MEDSYIKISHAVYILCKIYPNEMYDKEQRPTILKYLKKYFKSLTLESLNFCILKCSKHKPKTIEEYPYVTYYWLFIGEKSFDKLIKKERKNATKNNSD